MSLTTTLLLMTYNQAAYVAAALTSALTQEELPFDILVSDNHSDDETPSVIQQTLRGTATAHRSTFNARTSNSGGPASHINLVAPLMTTDLVVLQAGDDVAMPHRVRQIRGAFEQDEKIMAVYHGARLIDDGGKDLGAYSVPHPRKDDDTQLWFASANRYALGACLAIRRSLLDCFPALPTHGHEDVLLPFRAALVGRVVYLPLELLCYRRHSSNTSHDEHRLGTAAAYHQALLRNQAKAAEIARVKLADIDWAVTKGWITAPRAALLQRLVAESLADHDVMVGLSAPSLLQRVSVLWRNRHKLHGVPQRLSCLLQVLSPRLYLARRRIQRRRQGLDL